MKKIWKNISSRVWLIVMPIVLVIVIVVNVLASGMFFELVNAVFHGETTKLVGEETSQFTADFSTKDETHANGDKVTLEACEEGFTLLKNNGGALPLAAGSAVSVFGKNSVNLAIGGSGSGGSVGVAAKTIYDSLEPPALHITGRCAIFITTIPARATAVTAITATSTAAAMLRSAKALSVKLLLKITARIFGTHAIIIMMRR